MTRFNTAKVTVWMFILSEAVFFGFLIAAYVYYLPAVVHGPDARTSLDPRRTLGFTLCLIASSGTLWLAERRLAARRPGFGLWLAFTIVLGGIFIAGQIREWVGLLTRSITPERNLFGATFFTLTGFHGLHVLCGLVSLLALLSISFARELGPREISGVGAVSLYWHFVDVVWIVIFSLVYVSVWV